MSWPAPPATPSGASLPLAGRDRAQSALRAALAGALAGRGGLALVGGEAGIGKTTLAEALAAEAAGRGACVLAGRCHDLAETPPYGPWVELLAGAPPEPGLQPPDPGVAVPAGQAAFVAQVRDYLAALAARRPLLLLLEDLHWADPASLDLLGTVVRSLDARPILLLATYRTEDLARDHPLYALLPRLVREARPLRLDLLPLSEDDMRALVAARYRLPAGDAARLAAWLQARAEGNPFYAGELLRGLEEEGVLRGGAGGWVLGDPARASLPLLLRQVIDGRVAHLGAEAQQALMAAAVLGQEVPLALWSAVGGAGEETLLTVTAAAEAAGLLTVAGDGTAVRFAHALTREALYLGTPAVQRRTLHGRAGEALAALPGPDPDAVAYHFQRAGDPRAVGWLLRAAERAERAFAWQTAADRCVTARALLERQGAAAEERGWLGYRIAALRRYHDPRGALATLDDAARLAAEASDRVLAACTLFLRGNLHCYVGEFGPGLATLDAGIEALDALAGEDRERLHARGVIAGFAPDTRHHRGTLVMRLAGTGRFTDACQVAEGLAGPAAVAGAAGRGDLAEANASRGLAVALGALGRPQESRHAFVHARAVFQHLGDHFHLGMTAMQELQWVVLSYRADRPAEWEHLTAEAERAWVRAGDAPAELPGGFVRLPVLLLTGQWPAARELALSVYAGGGSYKATAARALAVLAREQGDTVLARRLIQDELPAGVDTPLGTANFSTALLLQRLAAALALARGDPGEACEWLDAHDRWLNWSGALLGRAEGEIEWAMYHRAAGDHARSRRHADRALAHAERPRQPLALLAAHRLLGELDTAARRYGDAAAHLEQALTLADACAAPFERALTLLALAELRLSAGDRTAARPLVEEARAVFAPLGAAPALARAGTLTARLARARPAAQDYPAGLSAREVEVLRLVAAGDSNREIAAALSLSARTVEKHIAHIYAKLGARRRADAAAYAVRHGLLPGPAGRP